MSKKLVYISIRNICCSLLPVLGFVCYPMLANAQTTLQAQISSGSDDLRNGNTAFINLVLINGEVLTEQILSRGLGSFKTSTTSVVFSRTVNAAQIRSIRIRHDGNPRSGHPFDAYDTWDLRTLRVNLVGIGSPLLYDSARDSSVGGVVKRFNSKLRQIDIPIRPIGNEPDFIVTGISASLTGGLRVMIQNVGLGTGKLTRVTCSTFSRAIERYEDTTLAVGQRVTIPINLVASGTVTCAPSGVDTAGRPEAVTANNRFSQSF